jgi:hypothetical protein
LTFRIIFSQSKYRFPPSEPYRQLLII